ncbi:glucosamine-6-phosphate deaminase [Komagataeibacter nataicola]|uniref:Glucosamine-6-phosphate deaminase n=1 Tax=Komagataeibacter nataicola TaxID=265960 RepID=A0A9N7CQ06_9PROT|nr:glucosamine-6-phosphate deaminase [Komagataeibacter nataicola]AQU88684.1 glucosamine-6-phosphate deaminase [Komagataeibacter nataicola]PYD66683.1 glucosamine-6-phosphate deaminase [Komagataeibacter nataicola]WNM08598.1 glucosamine-6-phosphate deaminase [Komagataeibacter nataicola]GBR26139.1 6-phosphogluconolactonase [Komagataeibacter nataicola NRIC 0616]
MKIVICPNVEQATLLAARVMEDALRQTPDITLGLATGRTMEKVYAALVQAHRDRGLDFSHCQSFNLDEYVGISPSSTQSYRAYMHTHLFSRVNIALSATHVPDGMATDLAARCAGYEKALHACGGVGLQLLGLGENGHIGFNEPFSAFTSRTRVVTLDPATREQNRSMFDDDLAQVPYHAVTMGVGTILDARRIVVLATGAAKARVVADMIEGPLTASISATALQMHANCLVITDEAAATALTRRAFIDHLMQHDAELQGLLS